MWKFVRHTLYAVCWTVVRGVLGSQAVVDAFSIPITDRVELKPEPLIGGPSWLLVHVKVVIDNDSAFDFVPQNATSPSTLQKLLSLQPVPALARSTRIAGDTHISTTTYTRRAKKFCDDYTRDLHLIQNNCWTFAWELVKYVLEDDYLPVVEERN